MRSCVRDRAGLSRAPSLHYGRSCRASRCAASACCAWLAVFVLRRRAVNPPRQSLLHLDLGVADHLAPLLDVGGMDLGERLRRAVGGGRRLGAELLEAL